MARIVYGVSGEGSGHSSRAHAMASHLARRGHEVRLVSYDRGYRNLSADFDVFETQGLHIANRDNKVSILATFSENFQKAPEFQRKLRAVHRELFAAFQPDAVVTDFEPMTAYLAMWTGTPLISLDNQHRIRYMKYPCPRELNRDRRMTELVVRLMVPRPWVSLASTFYFGEVKNAHTFLFPPILRDDVLRHTSTQGDHILVYLSFGFDTFVDRLRAHTDRHFVLYGYNRAAEEGNIRFKEFSREGFLSDMASSRGVIATAGFTTLTEALAYRKPYLALPMTGQFEQQLNGYLVEHLGYGLNAPGGSPEVLAKFLDTLDQFGEEMAEYPVADNSAICAKLDAFLEDECALLKRYRPGRRQGIPPE